MSKLLPSFHFCLTDWLVHAGRALVGIFSDADKKIADFSAWFQKLEESFDRGTSIQVLLYTSQISQDTRRLSEYHGHHSDTRCILMLRSFLTAITDALKLPVLPNTSTRPQCLRGTRIPIMMFILEWATRPGNNERILWLSGLASSGKSTIAATIADLLGKFSRLGSLVFFSCDVEDLKRPELVIRRWANGLASFDPRIAEVLDAVLKQTPGIIDEPLDSQFTRLIVEPLSSFPSLQMEGPIVMVIDALDECDKRRHLLSVLTSDSERLPPFIKVIITSRDEPDIRIAFTAKHHILEKMLEIHDLDTAANLSKFFLHRFQQIHDGVYGQTLPEPWPMPDAINKLEQHAGGFFIWASTVCNFIEGDGGIIDHQAQLELIIDKTSPDAESPIDKLYSVVLAHSFDSRNRAVAHDFKLVLSTMVAARTPLSSMAIAQLLDHMPCKSRLHPYLFVQPIQSLLSGTRHRNAVLRPLHPSFYNFLTVAMRSQHHYIDPKVHSAAMAAPCLDIIIQHLTKADICGVGDPFYLNRDISDLTLELAIPEALHYGCRFLVDHIVDVDSSTVSLIKKIETFLLKHLLHWIEALSLMKMLHVAHDSLLHLEQWIVKCRGNPGVFSAVPLPIPLETLTPGQG